MSHGSRSWVQCNFFEWGASAGLRNVERCNLQGSDACTPWGGGRVCTAFWCMQVCSWSSSITEATRWTDHIHRHLEQKAEECRDAIPKIQQKTPSDLWHSWELAPQPPLHQRFHGLYRPCLSKTYTDKTSTHSMTNGALSNCTTLYILNLVHPRCEQPGGWYTDETSGH